MNANDLKHRIAIYKYDRSVNSAGTPVEGFKFLKNCYAGIRPISGNLSEDSAPGTVHEQLVEITIRYDSQIDYNCKITYGMNTYRINYIDPVIRKGFYVLRCTTYNEINNAGQ
jgi:SPP1 family predicted phage head-tail adaptor